MITYPKSKINQRWDIMPVKLREVLYSPIYGEIIFQIAKDFYLDEQKTEIVVKLVGSVIYGFVHPEELDEKIAEEIDVDKKTAQDISDKINKKLFEQFRKEIYEMYSPFSEDFLQVESIKKATPPPKPKAFSPKEKITGKVDEENLPEPFFSPEKESVFKKKVFNQDKIPFNKPAFEKKSEKSGIDEPFVIHQATEKPAFTAKDKKEKPKKSFSLGSFFGGEQKEENFSAKIQTPFKKKEEEKTVNYSEYQGNLETDNKTIFIKPLQPKEEEIKKESNKKPDWVTEKLPLPASKEKDSSQEKENLVEPPKKEADKKEQEKNGAGPSVKGNLIDLRNF